MSVETPIQQLKGGEFLIRKSEPEAVFSPEDFSEELRMIGQMTEDFVQQEVLPLMERLERLEEGLNVKLLRRAGELGLLAIEIPEAYGGTDLPKTAAMLVAEKLAPAGGFSVTYGAHQSIGTLPIVYFGNEEQRRRYLPRLATGELIGAYALTEPNAGSDALGGRAHAVRSADGRHWVLNGTKMWITNAGFADLFTVFAKVDGEREKFSAFLVERSFAGLSTGAEERKMGIHSSSTRQLILENVHVPEENLLGEVGQGAKIAFNILNTGRFKLGAGCVGGAKQVLGLTARYALERVQFGRPIAQFGLIQEKLAEMALRTYAVESMVYRTAGLIDQAIGSSKDPRHRLKSIEEYAIECSVIKVMGSELLDYVVDEAVQIHGGYGYSQEFAVERAYRDSRINRIFEGTNEINRLLIVDMLFRRALRGHLPLMAAAERVAQEVLEPQFEEAPLTSPLEYALHVVENLKKATLAVAGAAALHYREALEEEQEIVARIADMLMHTYAAESALLRTRKLQASGLQAQVQEAMARLYVYEAAETVAARGKEALARFLEGDELRLHMSALRRFTRHDPLNAIALRRQIAQAVLEAGGYPVRA
ncbi:MAG: acyl-CoA dehydrogenase family protein [Bacteroidetes bacterium]|nr:acyl-CoA dehydrogenase family protein [Rhodothermia bacterium]MCS7154492.1 acyl-CoA dehydrogenase family protein [Bacteroidota bacterium]MCX7906865.1 acyl-CoA dehydrogenase family protein [Bacteroidota bacterium]MDW8136856.1 acyl-CoA dehydrogenase family protein [Bacteroidota bacterium]MDW8285274.1 acyl-CoA dehydrogenase family protein [Bacteroidota bacterium]